jgi:hypothetical protein
MAELHVINAAPVDATVVTYLEHLLARARQGEFSAVAVAYVNRDGSTGSGHSDQHSLATMVGAVACLQTKLLADMMG